LISRPRKQDLDIWTGNKTEMLSKKSLFLRCESTCPRCGPDVGRHYALSGKLNDTIAFLETLYSRIWITLI